MDTKIMEYKLIPIQAFTWEALRSQLSNQLIITEAYVNLETKVTVATFSLADTGIQLLKKVVHWTTDPIDDLSDKRKTEWFLCVALTQPDVLFVSNTIPLECLG